MKGFPALLIVLGLLGGLLLVRCAKQGTPVGGPKDETPPEMVSAIPPDRTLYFSEEKITITFNEFVQLKDPAKEIFVSPPMKLKPLYKVQGKKVLIEFQEELKENTTYTINFGNAVTDYTEGNPYVNFEYVFSTGGQIDSLYIPGKVINAFDLKPEQGILVMVYRDENDTIPLDSLPLRVSPNSASKSTKDGSFRINNLAAGEYLIFALEDMNNNFIFDLPNERIAFLDSLVIVEPPVYEPVIFSGSDTLVSDTIAIDTLVSEFVFTDTITTDSLEEEEPAFQIINERSYTLRLFEQADSVQKIISKKLVNASLLQYVFKLPVDSLPLIPVGFQPDSAEWYMTEFGTKRDTVNFWLKQGLPDTIRVCINLPDSLSDTSKYIISKVRPEKQALSRKKENLGPSVGITPNSYAGMLDYYKDFRLTFTTPLQAYDTSRLSLFTPSDTLIPRFSLTDSLKRHGMLHFRLTPGEIYVLNADDSAFLDISGAYSDSAFFRFKVRSPEDYGVLTMKINAPEIRGSLIIELLTEKEILVESHSIQQSGNITFDHVLPGNYKLRAIFDENSNGKWDTGNYPSRILPEIVEYYPVALSVRANWDMQEEWKIE